MKTPTNPVRAKKAKKMLPEIKTRLPASRGYAGKPMDGSQYMDVIEEQEYADRRPSAEEQKPRYSYMHLQDSADTKH